MQAESQITKGVERVVIKQRSRDCVGIERINLSRFAIGMVLSGEKLIQNNDQTVRVPKGSIFFMGHGSHLIEDVPTPTSPFEQILFYYTPNQIQHIFASFDREVVLSAEQSLNEGTCKYANIAESLPSKVCRNFFTSVNSHYECRGFLNDPICEQMKLAELIHYIIRHERGDILRHVIASLNVERVEFERIINQNIFVDKRVAVLADECNRSLTSFKKEFNRYYGMPPHQWFQQQRLACARMLLRATDYSIAEIGAMCVFPNPSHFIKVFKRVFGATPAAYREDLCGTDCRL